MKNSWIILFFLCAQIGWSQGEEKRITVTFENVDLQSAILQLEGLCDCTFFYQEPWVDQYQGVSGSFQNATMKEILKNLLDTTSLNYFLLEDRVILTNNNRIYGYLPKGFFGAQEIGDSTVANTSKKINSPIFEKSYRQSNQQIIPTVKIGKSSEITNQESFTISGYVTNTKTKKPLVNALIILEGRNTGVKTDNNGYYNIEVKRGTYLFEVNDLGMENFKRRLIVYNNGTLNIKLEEKIEQLEAVILQSDVNNAVTDVVTKTEIDIKESKNIPLALGERDVLKVAATLPGITTAGEGTIGYNVRGGKSDQNLILLDEAVVYNPQHFFGIFSALNPFVLGEANIYKSSIPASYGGRLSSVFDLQTKDASTDKFSLEGAIGPVTANIALETPIVKEKSGLLIGGRAAYANWILDALDEESLQDSEASFYDGIAKYNHQISKNAKLEAMAYWSRDDFSITSDSLYVYGNKAFSLRWNQKFNDKNSGEIALSSSEYSFDIEFDGDSDDDFELGYRINETALKLHFRHLYSDRLKFDYGVASKLYSVNPGSIAPKGVESIVEPLTIEKERALESAVFVAAEVDLFEKFTLDAGLRYSIYNALGAGTQNVFQEGVPREESSITETLTFDENEVIETYSAPEVRVSGRYLFTEDFSLKASYNSTYQYIHTLSNNTTVSPIDTWKLSDLNIEPQSSQQYALGLYKNFDDNTYEMSLEGFYKTSKNILDFKTGAEILLNENIETEVLQGKGKAYGVEFLVKKQKGKLYGWLGYTYSRSFIQLDSPFDEERVNNGDFFPSNFDRPHDFSLVTNYRFTKRFSLATNFIYQTGRPVTFPIGTFSFDGAEFTVFSDRNKFRIPDFFRLDIGLNIEGNHKKNKLAHGFWTISVYNVLGRNNPLSVFFVTEEGEVKALQSSVFSVPVPSITYNFKF
ncbi:TonB-dependent receptor [Aquimarina spongiae]|uniref:TonB-dependent Receptor Plug Domain n=1 Tax=Aquimarina spongiae TaxID=570521 RepID=A0A1M6CE29_9FLAO|nr:TonB-dependent receptor [Aquimarina spongiae]SHI59173.1 TonB-dependent Receptor Plug Domain [Aquimarina spongiae]